jgi:asparagine synthase (glutamine-hydrolysing)
MGAAKGTLGAAFGILGTAGSKRFARYANLVDPCLSEYYLSHTSTPFTPFNRLKSELYGSELASAIAGQRSDAPTRRLFAKVADKTPLDRMLYVDSKTWLPDDLLVKADKMTMATSVELRVPLLDFRILEFAASLPQHYKVKGWELKRILKSALRPSVPQAIRSRKKTGFPVPYDRWMRTELKEFVFDTILSKQAALASYFRKEAMVKLLDAHQRGEGASKEVFSLLVLELWHRQFVRGPSLAG